MNVALIQMDLEIGQPDVNFAKAESMMEVAMNTGEKPDLLVLPELWNTGFKLDTIHALADPSGQRTKSFISKFSRKHGVHVLAGSIAESVSSDVRNTSYLYNRQGDLVDDYSKIHLFRLMDEEKFLTAGDHIKLSQIEDQPVGLAICYDLRFPELARQLAVNGAKAYIVPAQWPHPRKNHWRTLVQARAIENQMFVIACNRVGVSGDTSFFGHSMVVDPWGEVLAEGGEEEEIVRATLDWAEVDRVRNKIPVFEDRRPSIYHL